jgi:3-hydroxyisobutyrate dehydrogenase
MGIALQLARQAGVELPLSGLGEQLWRAAAQAAGPGASVSELARWVEQQTKTELTAGTGALGESAKAAAPTPK